MKKGLYDTLDRCREMAYAGKDYLDIKSYLETMNFSDSDTKTILEKADEYLVEYQYYQQFKGNALIAMLVGGAVCIIGLMASVYGFAGTKQFRYLSMGIAIFGAYVFKNAFARYRLSPDEVSMPEKARKGKFERY